MGGIRKRLYLTIGWVAVGLGIIGAALPIMPTVPFLLIAFWAFARSSPRMSRRLLAHPHFGPVLRNWLRHGAIRRSIKILAVGTMAGSVTITYFLGVPLWAVGAQLAVCIAVSAYLITRPEPPGKPQPREPNVSRETLD